MKILKLARFAASACIMLFLSFKSALGQSAATQGQINSSDYSIVSRSPYSRVWQRVWLETNEVGDVETNIDSFTEVRSGICYASPQANGAYTDSSDEIDLVADGAQATRGQHQVYWAANANAAGGAVRVTTVGGSIIQSGVFGICYWDASSGTNIVIGGIQDAQGEQIGNHVNYLNAFQGGAVTADIDYTYTVEGLEQNIVFRQQLPDPSQYKMNPETTYLQVLTEFFSAPDLYVQSSSVDGLTNDEGLNFGDMSIGIGEAFLATNETGIVTAGPVQKEWTMMDNRHFLIEEVPFSQISGLQQALPEHASVSKPLKKITRLAALKQKPSLSKPKDFGKIRLASNHSTRPGLVIDYNLVNNATNLTFQGDATYYVSGTVNIYGTNIFEGGSVIKFTNNGSITEAASPTPQLNFLTAPYLPVVFTSKDDNSVGQTITGSTGNPHTNFYANPALALGSLSCAITNIRISYAMQAISASTPSSLALMDLQIVNGFRGLTLSGAGSATLRNSLFANDTVQINSLYPSASVTAENVTFGGNSLSNNYLVTYAYTNGVKVVFTNCIFSYMTYLTNLPLALSGYNNGFYSTPEFGGSPITNTSFPFQTAGAGGFYLASGSPFLNAAVTSVDSTVLADLAQETVYPPLIISGTVTNYLNLYPQAQRDSNSPSLGYHYYPVDWAGSMALSNVVLTVQSGTAIAAGGPQYGLYTYHNATAAFLGTATAPIHFVRYNTVQEQSNTNWETSSWAETFTTQSSGSPSSVASFQFTVWSVLGGDAHFNGGSGATMAGLGLENCQFYNGQFNQGDPAIGVTNCLFRRVASSVKDNSESNPYYFYNNLFTLGSFTTQLKNGETWTFKDNLFDTSNITSSLPAAYCQYNGYFTNITLTGSVGSTDKVLNGSPAYQKSFLGQYYYPTTLTNLINQGSRLASAAGLYHYTVTTNQAVEGNSQVSIGFHFVATDGNGNPLDSNGDGIPDYIEDANGDGAVSSGEIGWNLTNDMGLTVIITQPANNSIIP